MKPLYTSEEFNNAKSLDKLPCKCYECESTFYIFKKHITYELKYKRGRITVCSRNCKNSSQITQVSIICTNCGDEFKRVPSEIGVNNYCSNSCNASYVNKHKTHGTRRSKLEKWLEDQLTNLYPNLPIDFNKKDAIGSELDIYIPSLNLAIELNGIFHYEPIFGTDKLGKIQENDISKSKSCMDHKIDLCIIDTSSQKYVKPSTSQKYLDIITNIIKERLTS